jgi:plastocyanin
MPAGDQHNLTLKKGTYRFYCTVHATITGTFKVA